MPVSIKSQQLDSRLAVRAAANGYSIMSRALERLSSGLSINRASDDPAGLVISEQLRSRIASLNQEIANISQAIGKYQSASSDVGELRSQLTDLRSLAVGAANAGGNSETSQQAYAAAANQLVDSYNRAIKNAHYNGANTLDGSEGSLADISFLKEIDLSSPEAAAQALEQIDTAATGLDQVQMNLAATQKYELENRQSSLQVTRENLISAESQLRDADYGEEYSLLIKGLIQTKAALAMQAFSRVNARLISDLLGK